MTSTRYAGSSRPTGGSTGEPSRACELVARARRAARRADGDHWIDVRTRGARRWPAVDGCTAAGRARRRTLGCGGGSPASPSCTRASRRRRLVGVDAVPEGLELAQRRVPSATMVCGRRQRAAVRRRQRRRRRRQRQPARARARRRRRARRDRAHPAPRRARRDRRSRRPGPYDYYDRFLGHERRYGRGELAERRAPRASTCRATRSLGSLLYPAFWAVKKRNRPCDPGARWTSARGDIDAHTPLAAPARSLRGRASASAVRPSRSGSASSSSLEGAPS